MSRLPARTGRHAAGVADDAVDVEYDALGHRDPFRYCLEIRVVANSVVNRRHGKERIWEVQPQRLTDDLLEEDADRSFKVTGAMGSRSRQAFQDNVEAVISADGATQWKEELSVESHWQYMFIGIQHGLRMHNERVGRGHDGMVGDVDQFEHAQARFATPAD